jgi:hypothetical protein
MVVNKGVFPTRSSLNLLNNWQGGSFSQQKKNKKLQFFAKMLHEKKVQGYQLFELLQYFYNSASF